MTGTDIHAEALSIGARAALVQRGIEIRADGDLEDFVDIVHPRATNREAVDEPPDLGPRLRGPARRRPLAVPRLG